MSRVVRARYEKGVLKLLDEVDLEEGEEVVISIRRDIRSVLRKYKGALGRASLEELLRLEEEAHAQ
ncbi:MAG: antitoxin family protein [Desulfurococcales archaeon]|nr:antitoxin family protein [Desulfurococcales archaeon]